ncbi:MAG: hypothetical protein HFG63_08530, partial [Lachnospiraceae bacterium]|nr:hypothetical protein [Lachnospiraceae bacterium]
MGRRTWLGTFLLTVVLAVGMTAPAYGTKQDVEAAKKKASSLEEEKKKVEAVLKDLEGLKSDAAAYVKKLDGEGLYGAIHAGADAVY